MLFDINSPILRVFITEMLSYDHKVLYTTCNVVLVNKQRCKLCIILATLFASIIHNLQRCFSE